MSSYPYYNEAGEPLMDGSAMRYEMYLDSIYEPDPGDYYDAWDDEPELLDPDMCDHNGDASYPEAGYTCADCMTTLEGPQMQRGALDFPVFWSRERW